MVRSSSTSWVFVALLLLALIIGCPEPEPPTSLPVGSLRVLIEPTEARDAGAQWTVDSGQWRDSGAIVSGLATDRHLVTFLDIPGWEPPNAKVVAIQADEVRTVTGTYTLEFELHITNVAESYSSPYLLDFTFSLRDQDDAPIIEAPSAFTVTAKEDNVPISAEETVFLFTDVANKLMKCFLVLDYTDNMTSTAANGDSNSDGISDAIETMQAAAKAFIDALNVDAQAGIYAFHDEPIKVAGLTTDKEYLKSRIDAIWSEYVQWFPGSSRDWDAVYAALQEFDPANPDDAERYLVFLSEGRDESSFYTPQDIIEAACDSEITVYAVGFGANLDPLVLEDIAFYTNGRYYEATTVGEVANAFAEIARDLSGRYTLRWATQQRGLAPFTASFTLHLGEATATYTASPYVPTYYEGDMLRGVLRIPAYSVVSDNATIFLRGDYVPHDIYKFLFYVLSPYPFTVSRVGAPDGGLCAPWPDPVLYDEIKAGGTWIELRNTNPQGIIAPIPYGAFGPILRFDFTGLPEDARELLEAVFVDNTIYEEPEDGAEGEGEGEEAGGQYFVILGWDPPLPRDLTVSAQSVTLTTEAPSATLTVENGGGYTLSWTAGWTDADLTVAPSESIGNTVEVTISATDFSLSREVEVTFLNAFDESDFEVIMVYVVGS